jgi:hypothetical protein
MAIQLAGRGAIAVSFDDGFAELASVDRAGFPRIDVTDRCVSRVIGLAEAALASLIRITFSTGFELCEATTVRSANLGTRTHTIVAAVVCG